MKKLFYSTIIGCLLISIPSIADDDFFDDLMVTKEMKEAQKEEQTVEKGRIDASKLLEGKPKILKLEKEKNTVKIEETTVQAVAPIIYEAAPMGLLWLAPIAEIEYLRVNLDPTNIKDYPNSYKATNLPKPITDFRETILSFGQRDSLWRIISYGNLIDDDTYATKGLEQYRKYYAMLEKKYGNAEDFYTPAVFNVEEPVPNDDGTTSMSIRQDEMEIGDEGFLEKIASGEAVLYATFNNDKVAVTLALMANNNNQSFIVVDYRNLTLQKKADEEIYDAL